MPDFTEKDIKKINNSLASYEAGGRFFLKIAEVSFILNKTEYEIRYAIQLYRIDALLVADCYRIPTSAIRTFILDDFQEAYYAFLNIMKNWELSGVYALNFEKRISPVMESLQQKSHKPETVLDLLNKDKKRNYYDLDYCEDIDDWYDLPNLLKWPEKAMIGDWANILRISSEILAHDMEVIDIFKPIEWPDIYDYLIAREMINLPIPYKPERAKQMTQKYSQPSLF